MAKVMISLPDELLAAVDERAAERATSRSAFLAAAARRELTRREPAAMAAAVARSETRFRRSGSFEAAHLVRVGRDAAQ